MYERKIQNFIEDKLELEIDVIERHTGEKVSLEKRREMRDDIERKAQRIKKAMRGGIDVGGIAKDIEIPDDFYYDDEYGWVFEIDGRLYEIDKYIGLWEQANKKQIRKLIREEINKLLYEQEDELICRMRYSNILKHGDRIYSKAWHIVTADKFIPQPIISWLGEPEEWNGMTAHWSPHKARVDTYEIIIPRLEEAGYRVEVIQDTTTTSRGGKVETDFVFNVYK